MGTRKPTSAEAAQRRRDLVARRKSEAEFEQLLGGMSREDWLAIEREACSRSLATYIQQAWSVLEPARKYVHGWHIDAIADHLEAVTRGEIKRLYIAVPPGCMKSLSVDVFWPTWEWGAGGLPEYRYLATSHSERLAIRDNLKACRLIDSKWYQTLWGDKFSLTSDQNEKRKFENSKTGFREAMPFTSLTGSRGDRVLIDDPLSVDDAKSDAKRESVIQTFLEAVPTRLNDPEESAIVAIQQRLHVRDIIGVIEAQELGYVALVLPMEFERGTRCFTSIGFKDPREEEGELLFPDRFTREVVDRDKKSLGSYATACQFQQRPVPRDGGMFHRDWFEIVPYAPDGVRWVRGWDLAASEATTKQNPPYTAGVKLGVDANGTFYIGNVIRGQLTPGKVEEMMLRTAKVDGYDTIQDIPQDPGQAGKSQVQYLVKQLAGFVVKFSTESGSKEQRAEPLASQAEAGNVKLVAGRWNEEFLAEAEMFPNGAHKDQIDASSRAFSRLIPKENSEDISGPILIGGGARHEITAVVSGEEGRILH